MSKKASQDFDFATQDSELIDATYGAARVHLTWSGVVLLRSDSSLLNITFSLKYVEESARFNFESQEI
jgi:hypothetical protein